MTARLPIVRLICAVSPLLATPFIASEASAQCAGGTATKYIYGDDELIYCTDTSQSVTSAEADCQTAGTDWHLVTINSEAKRLWLIGKQSADVAMGYYQTVSGGGTGDGWQWRSGASNTYTYWWGSSPDDGDGVENGEQQCAEAWNYDGGRWDDINCSTTGNHYVCEGPPVCGSGLRHATEECDDGNTASGDGCSATCTLENPPVCGDGLVQGFEQCDLGSSDTDDNDGDGCQSDCTYEPGYTCDGGEPSSCSVAYCSGGTITRYIYGDNELVYCTDTSKSVTSAEADCQSIGANWHLITINNNFKRAWLIDKQSADVAMGYYQTVSSGDPGDGWQWRSGVSSAYTYWWNTPNDGDGSEDGQEQCAEAWNFDGGRWDDINCSATGNHYVCEGPPVCGSGLRHPDEECDDGDTASGDGCSSTCTVEGSTVCGDGRVEGDETCDLGSSDADNDDGDGCQADCTYEPGYTCDEYEPSSCSSAACYGSARWESRLTGTEYLFCETNLIYADAHRMCKSLGAGWNLVTIDDGAENDYLKRSRSTWIGYTDQEGVGTEGSFVWLNGSSAYTNWASGDPNNGNGGQDCTEIIFDGKWQDETCVAAKYSICEGPPFCGNGVMSSNEQCDVGDRDDGDGDGCDSSCMAEPGYACSVPSSPPGGPSVCTGPNHAVVSAVWLDKGKEGWHLAWETLAEDGTVGFVVSTKDDSQWQPLHQGVLLTEEGEGPKRYALPLEKPIGHALLRIEEVDAAGRRTVVTEVASLGHEPPRSAAERTLQPRTTLKDEHASELRRTSKLRQASTPAAPQPTLWSRLVALVGFARASSEEASPGCDADTLPDLVLSASEEGLWRASFTELASAAGVGSSCVRDAALRNSFTVRRNGHVAPSWTAGDAVYVVVPPERHAAFAGDTLRLEWTPRSAAVRREAAELVSGQGAPVLHQHVLEEDQFAGLAVSPNPDGEVWFWSTLAAGSATHARWRTTLAMPTHQAGKVVGMQVEVFGAWGVDEPQEVSVLLDGAALGRFTVADFGHQRHSVDLAHLSGFTGNETLELSASSKAAPGTVGAYLDRIVVSEQAPITADRNTFFESTAAQSAVALGSRVDAWLVDLTDPAVFDLSLAFTRTEEASVQTEAGHSYFLGAPDNARALHIRRALSLPSPQHSGTAVVAPAELAAAARQYVTMRKDDGAYLVSLNAIYDAYSHSRPEPRAIRQFVREARPDVLVLIGSGSYRPRTSAAADNRLPVHLVRTEHGLYASDGWYGDADEDGKPETLVGRLPVENALEAERLLQRVAAYEARGAGTHAHQALLMSGESRVFDFKEWTRELASRVPVRATLTLDATQGTDLVREQTAKHLAEGVQWFTYAGHGGQLGIDRSLLFREEDARVVAPEKLSLMTLGTCGVSRFEVPDQRSWSEQMLVGRAPQAIAVWGPSGLAYPAHTTEMTERFGNALFAPDERLYQLKDVIRRVTDGEDARRWQESLQVYNLLGDPNLTLMPGRKATVPSSSRAGFTSGESKRGLRAGGCAVSHRANWGAAIWIVLLALALAGRASGRKSGAHPQRTDRCRCGRRGEGSTSP